MFREFTTYDWYAYSGAFRLPGDKEPLICESEFTEATVIISGDAEDKDILVTILYEDAQYVRIYNDVEVAKIAGNHIVDMLNRKVDVDYIIQVFDMK